MNTAMQVFPNKMGNLQDMALNTIFAAMERQQSPYIDLYVYNSAYRRTLQGEAEL